MRRGNELRPEAARALVLRLSSPCRASVGKLLRSRAFSATLQSEARRGFPSPRWVAGHRFAVRESGVPDW